MKKAFIRVLSAFTALALAATPLAAASDVPEKQGAIIVSTIYSADTAEETSGCFTAYSVSELPEDLADYYYDEFFEENLLAVYRCVYPEVVSVEKIHFGLESVSFEDGVVSIETYRNYYLNEQLLDSLDTKYFVIELPLVLTEDFEKIDVNGKLNRYDIVSGDINVDGVVNVEDLSLICKYIAQVNKPSVPERAAADVFLDGNLNIKDLLRMCRYVAGFEESLGA